MSTPLYSLFSKVYSLKRLTLAIRGQYYRSFACQSSFTLESNANYSKLSNSMKDILDTVPPESEALSPSDTLNIFRSLCETSKKLNHHQSSSSYNVTDHKNFTILCQALRVSMPYLEMHGKFDILNALIKHLSVPADSEIFNAVLLSFHENLFIMSLNEIMILDRVLFSSPKSQIVDSLHRSVVDRFNLKSTSLKLEFNYFLKMRRMLRFIERNRYEINKEVFENMSNCAANQYIDILTANEAMDTIILLSNFGDRSEYVWPILDKAFDVWCNAEVTMQMVQITLKILVRRNRYRNDVSRYKDSRFIETCARTTITNGDIEKCYLVLQYLNQLEFTSKQLIDFLLDDLKARQTHKRFVYNCVSISIACDIGDYRPPSFHSFFLPLLNKMNFHQQFDFHLNWPTFALTLCNLGIHHRPLINEILKRRSQFETYQGFDILECSEMERLLNVNVQHLLPDLKRAIGKYMRLLVCTDIGHIVPMLVKIDSHSKKLLPFGDNKIITMNSKPYQDKQLLIALISSGSQVMQFMQFTVALDSTEWIELLQHRTHESLFNGIYNHIKKQQLNLEQMK